MHLFQLTKDHVQERSVANNEPKAKKVIAPFDSPRHQTPS